MALHLDVKELHQLSRLQLAANHRAIRNGHAEPGARRFDREVEQVEFQPAAGIDVLEACRVQPVTPGEVAPIGRGEHMQEGEALKIGWAVDLRPLQKRRCADDDMPFRHQNAGIEHRPLAITEADGAIEKPALGKRIGSLGADTDVHIRQCLAQPGKAWQQPALGKGRRHVDP
ncbi:hypothetical protein FQZ97_1047650 [compost metagenome]